ncbi:hypothetical protein A1OE_889 [Candidatus Endolissoclinum faulkneri L2]|uniref:Uncharacterized protein n=1 Tax=Candidatus Endolissoclinum faulkneri L2 TaxID=1193729 RepID=K7Z4W2_9PROT|nr:hypothetical protein A1OE_889 [Candidatus Endolissoclinum faulkneri L2]
MFPSKIKGFSNFINLIIIVILTWQKLRIKNKSICSNSSYSIVIS